MPGHNLLTSITIDFFKLGIFDESEQLKLANIANGDTARPITELATMTSDEASKLAGLLAEELVRHNAELAMTSGPNPRQGDAA